MKIAPKQAKHKDILVIVKGNRQENKSIVLQGVLFKKSRFNPLLKFLI